MNAVERSPPRENELFVRGVGITTTEESLQKYFQHFDKGIEVTLPFIGNAVEYIYMFVDFDNKLEMENTKEELDGKYMDEFISPLTVEYGNKK